MVLVDAEHRGPLVNVASFVLLISMIFFMASKVVTKWLMVRKLQSDDILMILASLAAIGECVAVARQVQSGLGQPEINLTPQQFDLYQKAAYVSDIFYVIPIYLAKMATLQFLIVLAGPNKPNMKRNIMQGSFYSTTAWLVIAVLCVLFQCGIPHPWNQASGNCIDQLPFWVTNGVIDILSQITISLAPVYLLFNLQLPAKAKRIAMASFAPNLTTIPLVILRLVYLFKANGSSDPTQASYNVVLVTVIHASYSIIAASVPFLKPFFDSLVVGIMTNDIHVPIESGDTMKRKDSFNPFAILSGRYSNTRNYSGGSKSQGSGGHVATATVVNKDELELPNLDRYGSQERMFINQTKTIDVDSKKRSPLPQP